MILVASFLGIKTGRCVMFNSTHSTCEIFGWCPVENDTLPRYSTGMGMVPQGVQGACRCGTEGHGWWAVLVVGGQLE